MTNPDAERDPYPVVTAEVRELLDDERSRARADVAALIDLLEAERARVAALQQKWQLAQTTPWQLRQLRGRAIRPVQRLLRRRGPGAS